MGHGAATASSGGRRSDDTPATTMPRAPDTPVSGEQRREPSSSANVEHGNR